MGISFFNIFDDTRVKRSCVSCLHDKAFERRSRSDCVHEQVAKRIANVRFTLEPAKHKKVAIYVVNQRISNVCRIAGCFAAEQFVGISWGPSYFVPMIHGLLRISCSRNPSYFYRIISAGILQVNQTGIPILLLRNISQRKKMNLLFVQFRKFKKMNIHNEKRKE